MDLHMRIGHHSAAQSAGLGTALVLGEQAAGGQHVRVAGVRHFLHLAVADPEKPRPSIRCRKGIGEKPWGAGMIEAGTRPEHAFSASIRS